MIVDLAILANHVDFCPFSLNALYNGLNIGIVGCVRTSTFWGLLIMPEVWMHAAWIGVWALFSYIFREMPPKVSDTRIWKVGDFAPEFQVLELSATPPEPRIWTVEELRELPVGTKIMHPSLGEGAVLRQNEWSVLHQGVKCVLWKDSGYFHTNTFDDNDFPPWDKPILVFIDRVIKGT